MEHTALSPAEMPADSIYWADSHRSDMLEWVDMKENSHDDMLVVPPVSTIRYRGMLFLDVLSLPLELGLGSTCLLFCVLCVWF